MNELLIEAPFMPLAKPDQSNIDKLREKLKNGKKLTEEERRICSIGLKTLEATLYDKLAYTPFICGEFLKFMMDQDGRYD